MSASSLADVRAARGGLDGGEGSPWFPRTSGIPLSPYILVSELFSSGESGGVRIRTAGAGSGVVEASETRRGVYAVGRGENVGLASDSLAIAITTTMSVVCTTGRHCVGFLPRLRWCINCGDVREAERIVVGWLIGVI
jgi:hypothetical protein